MSLESTAIISFIGQDKGLASLLGTSAKAFGDLTSAAIAGSSEMSNYATNTGLARDALDSITGASTTAIKSLNEVGYATVNSYRSITTNAERTIKAADILSDRFVNLGLRAAGFKGAADDINSVLQPTANFFSTVSTEATGVGKAFTLINAVEKPLVGGLKSGAAAATQIAGALSNLGGAGEFAAGGLLKVAGAASGLAGSVEAVNTVGQVYQTLEQVKETLPEVAQGVTEVGAGFTQAAGTIFAFTDATTKARFAAEGVRFVAKGTAKDLASAYITLADSVYSASLYVKGISILADGISEATLYAKDFSKALSGIENLGIDTYAAKLATSIGVVGERLLFNVEASKQFANAAISAFAKTEDALSYVTTLPSGLQAGIPKLSAQLSELVNGPLKNAVTKGEAAAAMYQSLSAGIGAATGKLKESQPFMEAALKLASGTETAAGTTVETLAKVTYAYNLNVKEATTTAAKLNGVVEEGILTFPQLAGNIGRVAGVAAQAKVPLDEMLGSVSALTKTMSADDAMTGYMSLLNSIAGAGDQATKAAAELGVQFNAQAVKAKGLLNVLKELYDKSGGNIEKIKEVIPDSLAFGTALTLMTTAFGEAKNKADIISKKTGGDLENLFGARQQSLIKQTTALMNGFEEVLADFGEKFAPALQPGLDFLRQILEGLKNMPEPFKQLVGSIVALNAGFEKAQGFVGIFMGMMLQLAGIFIMLRIHVLTTQGGIGEVGKTFMSAFKAGASLEQRMQSLSKAFEQFTGVSQIAASAQEKFNKAQQLGSNISKTLNADVGQVAGNLKNWALNKERQARIQSEMGNLMSDPQQAARYAGAAMGIDRRNDSNAQAVRARRDAEAIVDAQMQQMTKLEKANIVIRESYKQLVSPIEQAMGKVKGFAVAAIEAEKAARGTATTLTSWEKARVVVSSLNQALTQNAIEATKAAKAEEYLKQAVQDAAEEFEKAAMSADPKAEAKKIEDRLKAESQAFAQSYVNNMNAVQRGSILASHGLSMLGAGVNGLIARVPLLGATLTVFKTTVGLVAKGMAALWAMFGPIAIAMLALQQAFEAVGEIIPLNILGMESMASKTEKLAGSYYDLTNKVRDFNSSLEENSKKMENSREGIAQRIALLEKMRKTEKESGGSRDKSYEEEIDRLEKKQRGLVASNDQKYGWWAKTNLFFSDLGTNFSFNMSAAEKAQSREYSRRMADEIQAGVDESSGKNALFAQANDDTNMLYQKMANENRGYSQGNLRTGAARDIMGQAKDRKLSSNELIKITESETKAYEKNKEAIEAQVAGLQKLLEEEKDPERRATYQKSIEDLNKQGSALERNKKAMEDYISASNVLVEIMEGNKGQAQTKADSLMGQQALKVQEFSKKSGEAIDARKKDLYEFQEEAAKNNVNTLAIVREGMNTTGQMQNRQLNALLTSYQKFSDNVNNVEFGKLRDKAGMQSAADDFMNEIEGNLDNLSSKATEKLIDAVANQKIKLPGKDITESILSPEQYERLLDLRQKAFEKAANEEVQINTRKITEIQRQEALGIKRQTLAKKEVLEQEIKNEQAQLQAKQKYLALIEPMIGKESMAYKKLEDEVTAIANGIEIKKTQILQTGIDDRAKLLERGYQREEALLNLATSKGLKKEREAEDKLFEIKQKNNIKQRQMILEQINALKERGGDFTELETQLYQLMGEYEQNAAEQSRKVMERRFNDKKNKLDQEQILIEKAVAAGIKSERDAADEIFKIKQKQNLTQRKLLTEQIEEAKKRGKPTIELENQLLQAQADYDRNSTENNKRLLERRYDDRKLFIDKQQALLEKALVEGKNSEEKVSNESFRLRQQDNLARQDLLKAQIADLKKRNQDARALENELIKAQTEGSKIILEESAKRGERRKAQITNDYTAIAQSFQKQLNSSDLITKNLERQRTIQESKNKLVSAELEIGNARLENQLKLTGDIVKSADIQYKIQQNRMKILEVTQSQERGSLVIQNKLTALSTQREITANKMAQAENARAKLLLDIDILQAKRQNRSAEEVKRLELQRNGLADQKTLLEETGRGLIQSKSIQEEIAKNTEREMAARQQIAKEGGLLDLELARRQKILAVYDRQKELASLASQEIEVANQRSLNAADALTKQYERQAQVLEAKKSNLDARTNRMVGEMQIAMDLTNNELKKRDLAIAIAQIKYRSLIQQQDMEKKVLDIQQLQNKAAIEREKIQLRAQEAQNKADVVGAYADYERVRQDKKSTDAQKRAAYLNVEAKIEQGVAIAYQKAAVGDKEQLQKFLDKVQVDNLQQSQQLARSQAKMEIVNTLGPRDKAIAERQMKTELYGKMGIDYYDQDGGFERLRNGNRIGLAQIFGGNARPGTDEGDFIKLAAGLFGGAFMPQAKPMEGGKQTTAATQDFEKFRKDYLAKMQEFFIIQPPDKNKDQKAPMTTVPAVKPPGETAQQNSQNASTQQFGDVNLTIEGINITVEGGKDAPEEAAKAFRDRFLDELYSLGTKIKTKMK